MERPARVAAEPGAHLRMFVGSDVVEDRVDRLAGRDGGLNGIEEPDELLFRWRGMQPPSTALARTSRVANSVVVP